MGDITVKALYLFYVNLIIPHKASVFLTQVFIDHLKKLRNIFTGTESSLNRGEQEAKRP